MKKLLFLLFAAALLTAIIPSAPAAASFIPTDVITHYTTTVTPQEDGTLIIKFHLEWKVLVDTTEGPLTWVKIGIPNEHADEITAQSASIRSIRYIRDNGNYVRIDLDREYNAGETVTMEFQLHQSSMYFLNKRDQTINFSFTPGWFDKIEVMDISILWEKNGSVKSNAQGTQDTYYWWKSALKPGEKLTASVIYPMDAMKVAPVEEEEESEFPLVAAILIAIGVAFLFYWLARLSGGSYRGGFGGGHGGSASVSRSCVCACACACGCACACACAGGGRAGCSAKHFYKPNLSVEELKKALHADTR